MTRKTGPIGKTFAADDADRRSVLASAVEFAALTKPSVLPETVIQSGGASQTIDLGRTQEPHKNAHQSIGSNGVPSLAGTILSIMAPASLPWTAINPSSRVERALPPSDFQMMRGLLRERQRTIQDAILAAPIGNANRRDSYRGFFSTKRMAIEHLLIAGDVLEHVGDDLRIRVFRMDQYVTRRDGAGDVIYHIINEDVDPTNERIITREQAAAADIPIDDLLKKPVQRRSMPLYTKVEWNPDSRVWVIEQEINGTVVNTVEEQVTPFPSTTYTLSVGEHYGRGFIEQIAANLRSSDELSLRITEFADLASKHLLMIDENSSLRPEDLQKESGSFVTGARVSGGQVQDVAFFKAEKLADFSVVRSTLDDTNASLSRSFLTARDSVRQSERTTAFEVQRTVIDQLESALGNIASSIIDQSMRQLIRRAEVVLVRAGRIPDLRDSDDFTTEFLTGLAGFARQRKAASVRDFIQDAVALLGERALEAINPVIATRELAQIHNIDVPGLVRTDEEIDAIARQAAQRQLAERAADVAIQTGGRIVESGA
ncbi:MAG: hypothetical protein D6692_05410 [Planctomycetota bacterium]|nr:MAG: hypothetical protein D6692_05410 [Planctomycetota bacterium]